MITVTQAEIEAVAQQVADVVLIGGVVVAIVAFACGYLCRSLGED